MYSLDENHFLNCQAGQFPCPQEDSGEHRTVEAAGVGVTQGRVVRGQEMEAVGQKILGTVREAKLGFAGDDAGLKQEGEIAVEGDLSETNDDANAREGLDLISQVGAAVADLLRGGFVTGRGAADDGGDPGVAELESVFACDRAGFAGEAKFVQDGIHEVAGAVTGEGAAGAISSVGAGGKAEDEDSSFGVSEARNGSGPVGLILVGTAFGFADAAAVVTKTRAAVTGNDGFANLLEKLRRYLCVRECHSIP
jgi:hypothetical protein